MSHLWIKEVLLDIAFYATENGLAQIYVEASRLAQIVSAESDLLRPSRPVAGAACNLIHLSGRRQMFAPSELRIPE